MGVAKLDPTSASKQRTCGVALGITDMAAIGIRGEWMFLSCGTKLIATHVKQDRKPFVFDCSTAKKREHEPKADEDGSLAGAPGSDIILAFAISPSGKLAALTDDSKRLVLFECQQCWQCVSTRWLARRGTSLAFTGAEDEVLVADKSGDVYSFSVIQPDREGELKMGHLSMVLALTMSLDGKYIITADRDEKIRVSHLCSPYNIQSFCLGHKEFVSSLLVPSGELPWLLSGSGDGTIKLWEYETGQRLQSWDLKALEETSVEKSDDERVTVCRITGSPDGCHVAVQCDGVSSVQFFALNRDDNGKKLAPRSRVALPRRPLDATFDPEGRLWVLMDSDETPLQICTLEQSAWKCDAASPELLRATAAFLPHWETVDGSAKAARRFEHLHKAAFDNVAAYMEKKQQRLQEKQKTKTEHKDNRKKARKVL